MCSSPWETKFEWPVWTKNIFLVIDPAGPSGPCLLGEMSQAAVSTLNRAVVSTYRSPLLIVTSPDQDGLAVARAG